MARPTTSWEAIEAKAEQIVADVFFEVDELIVAAPQPAPPRESTPPARPLFGPRRSSELLLAGAALIAAGLVVGLWVTLLAPKTVPIPVADGPLSAAQALKAEQAILNNYRHQTEALALKLNRSSTNAAKDPFDVPGNLASAPAFPSLPQIAPALLMRRPDLAAPMLRLPPAPPAFVASLPPIARTGTLPPPVTAPAVIAPVPLQPVLVGVVEREGQSLTAVVRLGEELHDCSVGTVLKGGWVVGTIAMNHVILKRGGQSRTLSLGGDS